MPVLRNQRQEDCCKFKASWATVAKLALKTKQQTSKMKTSQNKTKPNHCAFQTVENFYCKGQNSTLASVCKQTDFQHRPLGRGAERKERKVRSLHAGRSVKTWHSDSLAAEACRLNFILLDALLTSPSLHFLRKEIPSPFSAIW